MRYTFFGKKCVTPFLERLSINGDSLDFGRLVGKIDDQRLARANGVVPNYFVVEPQISIDSLIDFITIVTYA